LKYNANFQGRIPQKIDPLAEKVLNAFEKKNIEYFKSILKNNSTKISTIELDDFHFRPLHIAARKGLLEFVKVLLEFGADANIRTFEPIGYTPIYLATESDNKEIV